MNKFNLQYMPREILENEVFWWREQFEEFVKRGVEQATADKCQELNMNIKRYEDAIAEQDAKFNNELKALEKAVKQFFMLNINNSIDEAENVLKEACDVIKDKNKRGLIFKPFGTLKGGMTNFDLDYHSERLAEAVKTYKHKAGIK